MIKQEDVKQEEKDIQKSLNYSIIHEIENSELGEVKFKGSDIKDKLLVQKGMIIQDIESSIRKMDKIVNELNEQPQEPCKGMPSIMKYGHNQIYPKGLLSEPVVTHSNDPFNENEEENKEQLEKEREIQDKMRDYNYESYQLVDCKEKLSFLKQIIDNIKENKEYTLPFRVANYLGIE